MAREHPFANIGLATGPESGICAIDIDPLAGGFETERKLRSEAKTWPIAPVQRTRSGGRHIILQHHPLIVTGSNRLGRGIDFRGAGGYIVAAPSIRWGESGIRGCAGLPPALHPLRNGSSIILQLKRPKSVTIDRRQQERSPWYSNQHLSGHERRCASFRPMIARRGLPSGWRFQHRSARTAVICGTRGADKAGTIPIRGK